jgi:hypothetical protein
MRRILINRACRKRAARHGGGRQRVDIQEVDAASAADDDQLITVSDTSRLQQLRRRHFNFVRNRFRNWRRFHLSVGLVSHANDRQFSARDFERQ